jgi:hypothetical protein
VIVVIAVLALVLVVAFVLPLALGLVALPVLGVLAGYQGEGLQILGWFFLVEVLAFLVVKFRWWSVR